MKYEDLKVLLVEDDDIARENAVEYLNTHFKNVHEAKDGLQALKLYNEVHPHIVITDIQMPKFSGLEFIERIREQDKTTQIIITSAFSTKEYLLKAVELQLVKYLIKPIGEEELNQALKLCSEYFINEKNSIKKLKNGFVFDMYNQTLVHDGAIIKLRAKEIALLTLLLNNQERFVPYTQIEQVVWEEESMSKDALKSLIRDLKAKLPENSLENLSGTGYKIHV